MVNESIISANNIIKDYQSGSSVIRVLNDVTISVLSGEVALLIGPSGSGKSTLLQILGLLDVPTSGSILINGIQCVDASDDRKNEFLRKDIAFIYQFHHLFSEFSVLENVLIPMIVAGYCKKEARDIAQDALCNVGLSHHIGSMPYMLSGGEKQRVALARAIAKNPKIILADEPTGNLDPRIGAEIFAIIVDQVQKQNIAFLCVTHNHNLIKMSNRCYEMDLGKCIPVPIDI